MNYEDLTGQRFGRLTVVSLSKKRLNDRVTWHCICDCGNEKDVIAKSLKSEATKSCGCYRKELFETHQESGTRLYSIWEKIIQRATNTNLDRAKDYSLRGIDVCPEWQIYENFSKWAKENGYKDSLSIDRIDNNRGYYPDNCRWATPVQQANNRRTNVMITYKDKTLSLADWARETGYSYDTIRSRYRRGWSPERIIETPQQKKGKKYD